MTNSNNKGIWNYLSKHPIFSTFMLGVPVGDMSADEIKRTLINFMIYIPLLIAGIYSFAQLYEFTYPTPTKKKTTRYDDLRERLSESYEKETADFKDIFGPIWNSISFIFKPIKYIYEIITTIFTWIYENPFRTLMVFIITLYVICSFYVTSLYKTNFTLKKWSGYTNTIMIVLGILLSIAVFTLFIDVKSKGDGKDAGFVAFIKLVKGPSGNNVGWENYKPESFGKIEENGKKMRKKRDNAQLELKKLKENIDAEKKELEKLKDLLNNDTYQGSTSGLAHLKNNEEKYREREEKVYKLEEEIKAKTAKLEKVENNISETNKSSFLSKIWWTIKQSLSYYKSLLIMGTVVCIPLFILWLINHFSFLSTSTSIIIGVVSAIALLYLIHDEFRGVDLQRDTDGWKEFDLAGNNIDMKVNKQNLQKEIKTETAKRAANEKGREIWDEKRKDDQANLSIKMAQIKNDEEELKYVKEAYIKREKGDENYTSEKQSKNISKGVISNIQSISAKKKEEQLIKRIKTLKLQTEQLNKKLKDDTYKKWQKSQKVSASAAIEQGGGGNVITVESNLEKVSDQDSNNDIGVDNIDLYKDVLQRVQIVSGNSTPSDEDKIKAQKVTKDIETNWTKTVTKDKGKEKIRYEEPKKGGDSILTIIFKLIMKIPFLLKDMLYSLCDFYGMKNPKGLLLILLFEVIFVILYLVIPMVPKFLYTRSVTKEDDLLEEQTNLANDKNIIQKEKYLNELLNGMSIDWDDILADGIYKANMKEVLVEYLKKRGYQEANKSVGGNGFFNKMFSTLVSKPRSLEAAVIYVQTNGPVIISLRNQIKMLNVARFDSSDKKKDADNIFRTKILLENPIYTDKRTTISQYKDIGNAVGSFNYNYAVSAWFFIHEQPPGHSVANTEFTSILNYANKPNFLFNVEKNTLRIAIKNALDKETVIYETKDFPLQKWNNVVVNYNGGTLDVFINSKLVGSTSNVVPFMSYDAITAGTDKGVSGGVCNVTYFAAPLSLSKIKLFYKSLKSKNPPIV